MSETGWRVALRVVITAALFAAVLWRIDMAALSGQFQHLHYPWLAAALALTVPQLAISAWRWRLTARCVGLQLRMGTAIREYYLATFLNQVLPGGVLGDAHRAWRHAHHDADTAAAWHAVFIERFSGQLSLALVTVVAVWQTPVLTHGVVQRLPAASFSTPQTLVALFAILFLLASIVVAYYRYPKALTSVGRFVGNTRRSLIAGDVWPAQLASSLLVVASYIGVFLLCGRAIGLATPPSELLGLIPPVLMAMALPLSIAGWGLREGAAALVWTLAGLPAHEGVALSLCYGALVLVSSLPGAVVLGCSSARSRAAGPSMSADTRRQGRRQ